MIRRHGKLLRLALMLVDGATAAVLSLVLYQAVAHPNAPASDFLDVFWLRALSYSVAWVALLYVHGAYRLRAHWTIFGEAGAVARATGWLAVLGLVALFLSASDVEGGGWALLLFPLQGALAVGVRATLRVIFMYFRRRGLNVRNVLVLGTGPEATAFARLVHEHSVLGVKVMGYLGPEPPSADPGAEYWGPYLELPRVLREQVVDEVALCVGAAAWPDVEELAQVAHEQGKLIRVPLVVPQLRTSERFLEDLDGTAVLSYVNGPDELTAQAAKRAMDIAFGVAGLILAVPLVAVIAVIMRVSQGPGIIFRQERVGLHGRLFTMYKLRTMIPHAEELYPGLAQTSDLRGAAFKLKRDPRVTPVGRVLRRYNLDELPQLWNVLKGEMSVVGPRPAPAREVEAYDVWHRRRLSMKPGITGLWQISRDYDDFDRRAQLDMDYIDRWSPWLDLWILFRTIPAVIRKPGP